MSESNSGQRQRHGTPVFILDEDSERTSGRDAQQANIDAGNAIAASVRTTLGPQGMDKMLVSDSGDVVITNDGATILEEMDIEHPAAQMLVDVADEQEATLGDGTTTAAILTGELLSAAEEFLDQDIHPRTVVEGYWEAERIASDAIDDYVLDDEIGGVQLQRVVESAMTGKGTGNVPVETLAETIVDAVQRAADGERVPAEAVTVEARSGRSASATTVVDGVVAAAEPVRDGMPARVDDAAVAVIDGDIEQRELEVDAEYSITSDDQLSTAVAAEAETLEGYAETLTDAGVDVVFVTGDIADRTASALASAGVLAFEDVDSDDATVVAEATGATTVPRVEEIESDDRGAAGSVGVETADDDTAVRVEDGAGARLVTVLVRGSTDHTLDEIERTVSDGIDVAAAAYNYGAVVPGGGVVELALAERLRTEAAGVEGRRQLAVEAAADAFDAIPRTLARNAGRDPIDTLVELRAANQDGRAGLVVDDDAAIADPVDHGVLDAAAVKRESVRSAVEVATMILRIDDVISAD